MRTLSLFNWLRGEPVQPDPVVPHDTYAVWIGPEASGWALYCGTCKQYLGGRYEDGEEIPAWALRCPRDRSTARPFQAPG